LLSFSLLLLGYTVLMLQGIWVASYTQAKNELISSHLFPAALTAQALLANYTEQSRHFEEAILTGEQEQLQQAKLKSALISEALSTIITDGMVPDHISALAASSQKFYHQFLTQAIPTYTKMLAFRPDEAMLQQAAEINQQSKQLLLQFSKLEQNLANEMTTQLQDITLQSKQHKQISAIVFIGAVLLSILFIYIIISRSILKPLRETVELANHMAGGDLSRKLTIHHHDEIGELAKAMNVMAGELESYYSDMEGKVKRRTARLEQANKQMALEEEQRQQAQQELIKALEAAKGSDRAKSAFLANMSHEIRTPMNGIIGMASLLAGTELNSRQQRYTNTITNSCESLLQIINDILDFSKVEAGKMELDNSNFNPHSTIASVTDFFAGQARDKNLNLFTLVDSAVPTTILGDEGRLRQIIINLVGNAIKFTKDGEIAIRVKAEEQHGEQITIRFAISDTGLGIPQEKIEHLFQPFTQADASTTRKFGGTGLGLSICQRLVELMDGEICVESSEGKGSTFWFTSHFKLPSLTAELKDSGLVYSDGIGQPAGSGQDAPAPHRHLLGKRILIADDDATNIMVSEAILETMGCQPSSVLNGQEALAAVAKDDFDLILMDSQMPIMSGEEATTAIRAMHDSGKPQLIKRSKIPIIALTADAIAGARQRFLKAGMDDYLSKPIRPETLQECLLRWLTPTKKATLVFPKQRLLKRLGGDKEQLTKIIDQARQDIPQLLAEIQQACTNDDYSVIGKPCQALKTIGAELGIAAVQHHALHLCLAAENNKCDPAFIKEFSSVIDEVEELLKKV